MKYYEICYLGGRYGSKRSYRFRITQIEIQQEPGSPNLVVEEKDFPIPPTLLFGKCTVKNLRVGDYLTAETEDDKTFKNFQRCISPDKPLDNSFILKASAEERAQMMEKRALNAFRTGAEDVDHLIDQLRSAMWDLSRSERSAFALYVYQKLSK